MILERHYDSIFDKYGKLLKSKNITRNDIPFLATAKVDSIIANLRKVPGLSDAEFEYKKDINAIEVRSYSYDYSLPVNDRDTVYHIKNLLSTQSNKNEENPDFRFAKVETKVESPIKWVAGPPIGMSHFWNPKHQIPLSHSYIRISSHDGKMIFTHIETGLENTMEANFEKLMEDKGIMSHQKKSKIAMFTPPNEVLTLPLVQKLSEIAISKGRRVKFIADTSPQKTTQPSVTK